MPIQIQAPDGSVVEFPDGTDDATIKSVMSKNFGGPTPQEQPSNQRDSLLGKADAFMRGAADTLSFGTADEIAAGLGTGFGFLGDYDAELARQRGIDTSDAQNRFGYRLGGQLGGGLVGGTGLVKAGLSPTAAAINSGWRLPMVAGASAVEGAGLGALQGLGSGEGAQDRVAKALTGAGIGAGVGAIAPLAVAGVQKALSPVVSSNERQIAAALLDSENIPLTAGQRTGSKGLRYAESELGGAKTADIMDRQSEAFTDAAMRRAGGSGRATSDNMAAMNTRLGQGFEDISARNALRIDQGVVDDMNQAAREYGRVLPAEQKAIFKDLGDDIATRFKAGQGAMSGKDYQTIRSRLSRMANNNKQRDPDFADAIRGLRNALDNGMERSINPADAGAWGELRRQYGNMKTLEKAIGGAGGEDAAMGLISPARLRMAAASGNRGLYARGEGDFADLAKAGQAVMTQLPNSGTAARTAVRNLGAPVLAGGGALAGGIPGMVAGLLAPRVAGAALMSKPVQAYLANQAATSMTPEMRAIINALINSEGSAAAGRLAP